MRACVCGAMIGGKVALLLALAAWLATIATGELSDLLGPIYSYRLAMRRVLKFNDIPLITSI